MRSTEEKTRICKMPEGTFDFLGYTFGRAYSPKTGKARLGYWPSKKNIRRMVEKIHALTERAGSWQETTELVEEVEQRLTRLGELLCGRHSPESVSGSRQLRRDAVAPVVALQAQSQAAQGGTYPLSHLYGHFGLVRLTRLKYDQPWA